VSKELANTPKARTNALMEALTSRAQTFQGLLPEGMKAAWFFGEVRVALARTAKLLDCDIVSMVDALTTCAQLGLSPSGRLGSAYLIPYKTKCTLVIGYRGYVDLAYRSGDVASFHAEVVYEKDTFLHREGLSPVLEHTRTEEDNPGPIRCVYAIARMKDGGVAHVVMLRREVLAIKARGNGGSRTDSPWATDEGEMWKKTAIRRLIKLLPLSPTRAKDLYRAEAAEREQEEAFDVEFTTPEDAPKTGVAGAKARLQARNTIPETLEAPAEKEAVWVNGEPSPEERAAILKGETNAG
jgi:recombination protein RecT